ncbi:MAG TPA: T9SS type A sorting domain-containing protein, partial [bacterium]
DSSGWPGGNNHDNEVAYNLSYLNEISGIWLKHTDHARVHHNFVFGNSTQNDFKGAITFYCGDGNEIYNNTIYDNEGFGIDIYDGTTPQRTPNSRVWNNLVAVHAPYNYAFKIDALAALDPSNQYHHNLWHSLDAEPLFAWAYNNFFLGGRILTFSQYVSTASQINPINGDGDFVADPLLTDPAGGDYSPQWGSPAVDAGPTDPATYDSDGTRADLGAIYFDQSGSGEIAVTATPSNPPIVIPANGGSFSFRVILTNVSTASMTFEVWTDLTLPVGGHFGPVIPPRQIALNPGASLTRRLTQLISASSPAGQYTLNVYAGDSSPVSFFGSAHFTFQKLGEASAPASGPAWAVSGSLESPDDQGPNSQPAVLRLCGASPNPFNPRTTINYQLSANSQVSLRIYDTAGRLIQTLVEGWQQAGTHEIGFDGSGLSSGIYLYRLEAGEFTAIGKLLLIK